jgi:tRNA(His) 5'-end guanylyltransferase
MLDAFGDRMKVYEAAETERVLDPAFPVYARLDGRSFSRLTRQLAKPYDVGFTRVMGDVTRRLVEETNACIGYTQSDEISLVWPEVVPPSELMFGGKIHKLTSILASLAAASFQAALPRHFWLDGDTVADLVVQLPHFDARVFSLPSRVEAANAVLWRTVDARRNAIQGLGQSKFSHKALQGRSQGDILSMLAEVGVNFEEWPDAFKWGSFYRRVAVEKPGPDGLPVIRHEVRRIDMPEFRKVSNRVEVIFDGAEPICSD